MKKSFRLFFASVFAVLALSAVSFAQEGDKKPPSINDRQENQRDRIKEGVQEGDISKREAKRLAEQQADIRRQERRAKSDGEFTKAERARVQRNLSQASRSIRRAGRN